MQFRVRGASVHVVKTIVDKKTLKSTSVLAGAANLKTGVLSDQLAAALNDKEVQEVRRWIASRQKLAQLRAEIDARFLDEKIYEAMEWLKDAPPAAAREIVEELLRAMTAFRHTMIRLGLAEASQGKGPRRT